MTLLACFGGEQYHAHCGQRAHQEIGIRRALGASPPPCGMIVQENVALTHWPA